MKFLHNKNYRKEVEKIFSNEEDLNVAVAFFGKDSLELFDNVVKKNFRVICNLQSGACNPFLVEAILNRPNVRVKSNAKLHAKTLIQNNTVIIGSANMSSNGLSLEDGETSGWIETGILTSSKKVIAKSQSWFKKTWKDSEEISDTDLEKYQEIWKNRRNSRILKKTGHSLLQAANRDIEAFQDRNIYFAIYRYDNPSKEAIETHENAKSSYSKLSKHIDYFEDWSELPENSDFISIYVGDRYKEVSIDGLFRTHKNNIIEKFETSDGEPGEIILLFKENNILGYKLTENDKKIIEVGIRGLMKENKARSREGFLIPFSKGVSRLSEHI